MTYICSKQFSIMKFLDIIIKFVLIIIWSFALLYLSKAMGFSFDPDEMSGDRNMVRIVLGVLILVGAYFIWMLEILPIKKK